MWRPRQSSQSFRGRHLHHAGNPPDVMTRSCGPFTSGELDPGTTTKSSDELSPPNGSCETINKDKLNASASSKVGRSKDGKNKSKGISSSISISSISAYSKTRHAPVPSSLLQCATYRSMRYKRSNGTNDSSPTSPNRSGIGSPDSSGSTPAPSLASIKDQLKFMDDSSSSSRATTPEDNASQATSPSLCLVDSTTTLTTDSHNYHPQNVTPGRGVGVGRWGAYSSMSAAAVRRCKSQENNCNMRLVLSGSGGNLLDSSEDDLAASCEPLASGASIYRFTPYERPISPPHHPAPPPPVENDNPRPRRQNNSDPMIRTTSTIPQSHSPLSNHSPQTRRALPPSNLSISPQLSHSKKHASHKGSKSPGLSAKHASKVKPLLTNENRGSLAISSPGSCQDGDAVLRDRLSPKSWMQKEYQLNLNSPDIDSGDDPLRGDFPYDEFELDLDAHPSSTPSPIQSSPRRDLPPYHCNYSPYVPPVSPQGPQQDSSHRSTQYYQSHYNEQSISESERLSNYDSHYSPAFNDPSPTSYIPPPPPHHRPQGHYSLSAQDGCYDNGGRGGYHGPTQSEASYCTSPDTSDNESIAESIYHQPPKAADRGAAYRLAKRLYNLEGFKVTDVIKHLCKRNDFSQLVSEEYLCFFDFVGMTLDVALRCFLSKFTLEGETSDRERVLHYFSRRYLICNPETYNSEDACHTLVCALMLLNTDLHGQNIGRKMTCHEFILNLSELNNGEDFPKDELKQLYNAIKQEPISFPQDTESMTSSKSGYVEPNKQALTYNINPFVTIPSNASSKEYMRGFVMRKWVMESHGKKTSLGKRGWKMYFARLRDLTLSLHKDAESASAASRADDAYSAHSVAMAAQDLILSQNKASQMHTLQQNGSYNLGSTESDTQCDSPPSSPTSPSPTTPADNPLSANTIPQYSSLPAELPPPPPPPQPGPLPEAFIAVHHSIAYRADDYTKKRNVFRLKTKEGAEYLFQVSDTAEVDMWVENINYAAALLSAAPLSGGVGSEKSFYRPLLPSSITRLSLREQLESHQKKIFEFSHELKEHTKTPPKKSDKARIKNEYEEKKNYLEEEVVRYKSYARLLETRLVQLTSQSANLSPNPTFLLLRSNGSTDIPTSLQLGPNNQFLQPSPVSNNRLNGAPNQRQTIPTDRYHLQFQQPVPGQFPQSYNFNSIQTPTSIHLQSLSPSPYMVIGGNNALINGGLSSNSGMTINQSPIMTASGQPIQIVSPYQQQTLLANGNFRQLPYQHYMTSNNNTNQMTSSLSDCYQLGSSFDSNVDDNAEDLEATTITNKSAVTKKHSSMPTSMSNPSISSSMSDKKQAKQLKSLPSSNSNTFYNQTQNGFYEIL